MDNGKSKHFTELLLDAFTECVEADPKVPYTADELEMVLRDLVNAVVEESYITATPTVDNPALSDDYVFDSEVKDNLEKHWYTTFCWQNSRCGKRCCQTQEKRISAGVPICISISL